MTLHSFLPFNRLLSTFSLFWKSILFIPIPALIDIIFVFLYGFSSGYFNGLIQETLSSIFQIIGAHGSSISAMLLTNNNLLNVLHQQPGFSAQYSILLKTLFLFCVTTFFLYVITQLFSWKYCTDVIKKTKSFKMYAPDFFLVTVFWAFFFFFLLYAQNIYLVFLQLTQRGQEPN